MPILPELLGDLLPPQLAVQLAASPHDPQLLALATTLLRAELAALAAYVPLPLLYAQLQVPAPGQLSGAFWQGSILFADLSGFTALSGQLSALGTQGAEELSAIITTLFGALVAEVHAHGGSLLKFGGDALTAFFDATHLGAAHATLACAAALAMQRRMLDFTALTTRGGTFRLRLRIGVHSGQLFAAEVGDHDHIELVVTGHDINRVATAQEIAEPGEVVISEATSAQLEGAQIMQRAAGFWLLQDLPATPQLRPHPAHSLLADVLAPTGSDLAGLATRVLAVRPYLPRGLQRRFLEQATPGTGEFRPVTTLFVHFWPFSDLLDHLAEAAPTAARVLNAYYQRAQAVIHRYGGIVNKVDMYTHGDKLMVLFGAPTAHEDDPQRAVRVALELRGALAEANEAIAAILAHAHSPSPPMVLRQRAGINTGIVFAGLIGGRERHEYTVMGQPVNLAARLMGAANEGAIVLSPTTRRAVAHTVALRSLAPVQLKGISDPVPIAEVLRPLLGDHSARTFVAARQLVGRTSELAQLTAVGASALAGHGQIIALSGQTGSGKSVLAEAVLQRLAGPIGDPDALDTPFRLCRVRNQSYEQTSAYAMLSRLLHGLLVPAGQAERVSPVETLDRIGALVPDQARFSQLIGPLLGFTWADTPLIAALSPAQRYERTRELITEVLLALASERPLAVLLDDLHWCDASSIEMLLPLFARLNEVPLFVLLVYRSDTGLSEPWGQWAHTVSLPLGDLPDESMLAMAQQLLGGDPPTALAPLLTHAHGNPLFIEELVRELRDSGVLQRTGAAWLLVHPPTEIRVPERIEGVIVARLDRLEERYRETIQVASVVGQRFAQALLADLIMQANDLAQQLERLDSEGLITPEAGTALHTYLFRHALIRDVAYDGLLFARRRLLHQRVAQVIERAAAGQLDDQLPLLARHYLLAEAWPEALRYHLLAGRFAQSRYALREAQTLLEQALRIATDLPLDPMSVQIPATASHPWRLDGLPLVLAEIHERLGWLAMIRGDYDTALEHYHAALHQHPSSALDAQLRLHHHIAQVYEKRTDFETAFRWIATALALPGSDTSPALSRCLLLGAGLHMRQGRYQQALEFANRAYVIGQRHANRLDQARALKVQGNIAANTGDNLRALDLLTQSVAISNELHDLQSSSDARNDLATVYHELGRLDEARSDYEAALAIKRMLGDRYGEATIANNLGDLLKLQGDIAGAIVYFQRSLLSFERLGSLYATALLQMNLGSSYLLQGDLVTAETALRSANERFHQAGGEEFLPEVERYLAELALRQGYLAVAQRQAEQALATAQRLEASAEEGITRRVLAEILIAQGDHSAAWAQLEQSLILLRAAASPIEEARTLAAQGNLGGRGTSEVGQPRR